MKASTYRAKIRGVSPYGQCRYHGEEKLEKELADAYEKRTWKNRLHVDKDGIVFVPQMAIKNCLSEAAKFLGVQIPGKGKSTYTKHFEAGVMVFEHMSTGVHIDDVVGEPRFVPADGIRGSGKRVFRIFPRVDKWQGEAEIYVCDEIVTKDVLRYHLEQAGNLIGLGSFRPRNNGFWGRFVVSSLEQVK